MILVGDMRLLPYFLCGGFASWVAWCHYACFFQGRYWKIAGVSWNRKAVCADQDRRLRCSEFLPTHCSHNVDRKRGIYEQFNLNGFLCKRDFWPVQTRHRVTRLTGNPKRRSRSAAKSFSGCCSCGLFSGENLSQN